MKNKPMFGALVVTALVMFVGTSYGKTVVIESKENKPVAVVQPEVKMNPFLSFGEGKDNKGFHYGTFFATDDKSFSINKIIIEANGFINIHPTPRIYACYIVTGEGTYFMVDEKGNEFGTITYKPGDLIILNAATPESFHHWKNGPKETVMIGIQNLIKE